MTTSGKIGLVLIGRNEGERLKASLKSCSGKGNAVVYVDSGSTDGSVEYAKSNGADVVDLDLSIPFTAARARNAGFERLLQRQPDLKYVHFIDGDCILQQGWLKTAEQFMENHPDVAVVCGIRRELYPEKSLYNWMCDLEWNQPAGETSACGGDAMFRVAPFRSMSGYNASLLCGEEPELCLRLRKRNWRIWRLADTMTMHDAAILSFSQYWKRAVRSGYGNSMLALVNWREGASGWIKDTMRPLLYVALGVSALPLTVWANWWGLLPLVLLGLQVARIARKKGATETRSWKYALVQTATKLAEVQGIASMVVDVVSGKSRKIIEYK
jgi:glycosyltransferase involved in cell wall biosynthesis